MLKLPWSRNPAAEWRRSRAGRRRGWERGGAVRKGMLEGRWAVPGVAARG